MRIIGPLVLVLGAAWVVIAVAEITGTPRGLLALVTLVVVVAGLVALLRPPRVLTLTDEGYRVSLVRGAGVYRAAWTDVESVGTQTVGGALALVFSLKGGAHSAVPLTLLGQHNLAAQREVHQRLNDAHGYRRL
jgi:hypothetical protein